MGGAISVFADGFIHFTISLQTRLIAR